jgi:hypothetical protein
VTPTAARLLAAIERVKVANFDLNENAKTVLSRLVADCGKEGSRDVDGTKQNSRGVEAMARIA